VSVVPHTALEPWHLAVTKQGSLKYFLMGFGGLELTPFTLLTLSALRAPSPARRREAEEVFLKLS
jgi:hypothetical protein